MPQLLQSLRLPLSVLLALVLAVGAWWVVSGPETDPTSDAPPYASFKTPDASTGTKEDPYARFRYEWMRLRDPSTGRIPEGIRSRELDFATRLPKRLDKTSSWIPRGPVNIGGRTRALALDVTDPTGNTILAGGVSGGMWRTTDGGATWTRTFTPRQRPNVTSLVQDTRPGQENVWYAGTGERLGNSASGGGANAFYVGDGIYKSTDGGQSWSQLANTTSNRTIFESAFDLVNELAIDPSNTSEDEVYAATYGAIQRSLDGGTTWSTVLNALGGDQADLTDVAVTSSGVVYATVSGDGSTRGLFRSPSGDAGTFVDITPPGWPSTQFSFIRTEIGINPSNEDEVWFIADAPGSGPAGDEGSGPSIGHILWMYDAGSDTWRDFSSYLPTRGDGDVESVSGATGDFNSQSGYDLYVAVHPDDGSNIFVGGRNLWRIDTTGTAGSAETWIGGYTETNDSFALYAPAGSDTQHPDQHAVAFLPGNGDVMFTGSDGGVHRTDDSRAVGDGGVKYTSLNNGYTTTQFYSVCANADPSDPSIMGGMQDNGTWVTQSSDASVPWTEQRGGDGAYCAIVNETGTSETIRYASSQGGNLVKYDCDASFNCIPVALATPVAPRVSGQLFIHPFEIDASDSEVMFYPVVNALWRNADVQQSPSTAWTELTGAAAPSGHQITTLATSTDNASHVLYYGTVDTNGGPGRIFRLDDAHTSAASTAATDVTDATLFPDGGYVSDIAVDPSDSDRVLMTVANYGVPSLFFTNDGGQTWTDVGGNLEGSGTDAGGDGPSVRTAAILPQGDLGQTTYYVGTSVGLFSTTTLSGASTTWAQEGPNDIGSVVVDQVYARPADGLVLVGTHANGVFSAAVPIPVELTRFDAVTRGQNIDLEWETASETNSAEFRLEHRYREGDFETLHTTPGAGTTRQPQTYSFRASGLPPGPHTFRLRQIDVDGTSTISEERSITLRPAGAYDLTEAAPNPFRDQTRLRLTVRETQPVTVHVYNTLGQRVRTLFDDAVQADVPVDLSFEASNLGSGTYFVRVTGTSFSATRKTTLVR